MNKKLFLLFCISCVSYLCSASGPGDKQYPYDTVANDPTHGRIYHLANGLTVFLSPYKAEPRIQTYIAVKAGSKFDPHDATGLAHYLEHMLFKGTEHFGTKNYAKEKPYLDEIENLFETYRGTTDERARKKIYHQIDSVSFKASYLAIANEYDKLMADIGSRGSNAFTSVEQTVFEENIPSNEMDRWLQIQSDRFLDPVMRLFHTELEAVYEEKNTGLDNDYEKVNDALMSGLFQKHPYGTQTTIGTIHDLKNPSLKDIIHYFHTYYAPNNMVVSMSGDLNPDSAIREVDKYFGGYVSQPVPVFSPPVEEPITTPIYKTVVGPNAASVSIGYRFTGAGSKDADMLDMITQLLSNGQAGLFEIDLNQKQKVLNATANDNVMMDYSCQLLQAYPKEGQSLEEARDALLEEIAKLKQGDFPDWLMQAVINNMRFQLIQQYRNGFFRAFNFVQAFTSGESWSTYVNEVDRLQHVTKNDIVQFANEHYKDNYVVVYKKVGEDTTVEKVKKPRITPVETNPKSESAFVKNIENEKVQDMQPVFVDYKKEIQQLSINHSLPLYYVKNNEDSTFNIYFVYEIGTEHNKVLRPALDYLQYAGTSKLTAAQVQQEFYKMACSFNSVVDKDRLYINLTGLTQNFVPALKLIEDLVSDAQPDTSSLNKLAAATLKQRENDKMEKNTILFSAMFSYGIYGSHSPFTNVLSNEEISKLKAADLTDLLHKLNTYPHHVLYYGSDDAPHLIADLEQYHHIPAQFSSLPKADNFPQLKGQNQVYVVDHDMKQVEIVIMEKADDHYEKELNPVVSLYNEYFGGSMASITFQTLRESKALAYSTFSSYSSPGDSTQYYSNMAYIGSQEDKLGDAINGMMSLLNDSIPQYPQLWLASKQAVLKTIASTRIIREGILFNYENARKLGLNYDTRKDVYEKVPNLTFAELEKFHNQKIAHRPYTIMVIGNKKDMDLKALEKYGKVSFLTMQDIFGY